MAGEGVDLAALEALIFSSDGPCTAAAIRRAFPALGAGAISPAVAEINEKLRETGRPYEIAEVAAGWQFRTRPEYAEAILAAKPERKLRLSRAALETLALVAYRQPLTRPEIEDLRGVDCGAVLKSLLERDLIRIVGRRDAPGRPALFGTTATFLETFALKALTDLPPLREAEALMSAPAESSDVVNALAEGEPTEAELAPVLDGELEEGLDEELAASDPGEPDLEAKLH
jgi:segregation and condensation protein B